MSDWDKMNQEAWDYSEEVNISRRRYYPRKCQISTQPSGYLITPIIPKGRSFPCHINSPFLDPMSITDYNLDVCTLPL